MCFASIFSGGFITAVVVNQPERKLAKRTSVRSTARNFMVCIKLSHDFFRSKSGWEWKICPKYWRFCQNCNMEPNKCKYSMGLQLCYLLLTMQKFFKSWPSCKKKAQEPKRHIGMKSFWWSIQFICVFTRCLWNIFVTIMCRNVELSSMMSWVGCLLTDSGLPAKIQQTKMLGKGLVICFYLG